MSYAPDPALRRFPSAPAVSADLQGARHITDLTHRSRMGLRGRGTSAWCAAHGLPFPESINSVVRHDGLRIARLGSFELLVLFESDKELPAVFADLPAGAYSGYREESWAWFRFEGTGALDVLSSCTSADLMPSGALPGERVVQTRFAGLDAVIILTREGGGLVADVFADIASHGYLLRVFEERCPEFGLVKPA